MNKRLNRQDFGKLAVFTAATVTVQRFFRVLMTSLCPTVSGEPI